MTPAQRAKVKVYSNLGYKPLGMVDEMATVVLPLPSLRRGGIVQVIAPDGSTIKTFVRRRG